MVAHSCIINNLSFRTKKDLQLYTQKLLDKLPAKVPIKKGDTHFDFLKGLFDRHPIQDTTEVDNFIKVGQRDLVYNDSHTFSWKKCISQKDDSPRQKYLGALRVLIAKQVRKHRENSCSKCGLVCRCEVDHILPFKDIVLEFEKEYENIDIDSLKYMTNSIPNVGKPFDMSDEYTKSLADCFYDYHKEVATYQSLCTTCHRKKTNGIT